MKKTVPTRTLAERPDLAQLKRQAKELRTAFLSGDPAAAAEVAAHLPRIDRAFALHDAQFVLARCYGFDSWPKLKAYVDGVTVGRLADAVRAGNLAVVRALLKARPELVNFDQSESDERRPIHFAVMARNAGMTRLLMQLGADARAGIYPHRPATTAFAMARDRGYTEIVAILEEEEARRPKQPRRRFEPDRQTEAEAAIERNDAEWLRARHAEGALEQGLLTAAVKLDRPDMLRLLLDLGFDPNEPTRLENIEEVVISAGSPLWHAADAGNVDMVRLLLERGADPNLHVYASGSSVYSAYRSGHRHLVELMKQYGGIVDPITAALYGEYEIARRHLADEAAGKKLTRPVLTGRNVSEDLLRGADVGDAEMIRLALPGVDWGPRASEWHWMMMQAVWAASVECLRLLVARCDLAAQPRKFGRTILHDVAGLGREEVAAKSGELAAVLLDAGAPMDVRDDLLCSTPLGWACRSGRVEMVRVLLDRGADREELTAEEWTRPRRWAERMGHPDVLQLLDNGLIAP